MTEIDIPFNYTPRHYQLPLMQSLDKGIKRAFCFWHRRAGKDKTMINIIMKEAFQKVGIYYYFFPTYTQGKKILWDNREMMDHIPKALIDKKNDSEMKIKFVNGSMLQLIGTDNYDAVRGTNPVGCVFSEYAFQNPMAWEVVRPILAENRGWAIFNSTPNGENHAFELFEMANENPKWFCQKLTIDDTGAVHPDIIQEVPLNY